MGSHAKGIMIAATRQHVGKTTTSVALFSGIRKRFGNKVGFMKPVGQTHIPVISDGVELKVDKDVKLFKDFFQIDTCSYKDMSPVVIPNGYTRKFLDGEITEEEQINSIKKSFANICSTNDYSVVEGTGHCGVGSIVKMDNARVASILGLDMVLVVNGGLGSAFDELALNRLLCLDNNVNIKGVVVNKVTPGKEDMIRHYFTKALNIWNIPLLGVVPDVEFLGRCTMTDYELLFKQKLLAGSEQASLWHFDKIELLAMQLPTFLEKLKIEQHSKTLFVTHATRADIVLAFLMQKDVHEKQWGRDWRAGLILSGKRSPIDPILEDIIKKHHLPVLVSKTGSYETMLDITNYTAKLNPSDINRTKAACAHYEKHIDFDMLLK